MIAARPAARSRVTLWSMAVVVAVDFGEKRIGARDLGRLGPAGDAADDPRPQERRGRRSTALARFCRERGGEPRGLRHPALSGGSREPVRGADPLLRRAASPARPASPVRFHEETLTSDEATRRLPRRARREDVDRTAAAVLLEDFLQHAGPRPRERQADERRPPGRSASVCSSPSSRSRSPSTSTGTIEYPAAAAARRGGHRLLPVRDARRRRSSAGWTPRASSARRGWPRCTTASPAARPPSQAGEYRFARPTPLSDVLARMGRGDVVRHVDRRARGPDRRGDLRALLEPGHQPPRGLPPRARQPATD